jgi:hypothetical protein
MKHKGKKTKNFNIKLVSIDPTGAVLKSEELSMPVIDDPKSTIKERLFLKICDCLYRVDRRGFVMERIIPKEN